MQSIHQLDATSLFEHTAWMRGLAQRLVSGPQADDLVQEAWSVAVDHPPADGVPLKAWLSGIMRRAALNARRSDRHRANRESIAATEKEAASTSASPTDELVALAEEKRFVIDAVLRLPEAQRQVILLRYYEGLAPRDIAAQLSMPVNTVHTHRERGLAKLRESLDERHSGDRRAWGLALLPLAREATVAQKALVAGGTAAASGAAAQGISLAAMKALAVLAAIIAVIVGGRIFLTDSGQLEAASPAESADLMATASGAGPSPSTSTKDAPLRGTIDQPAERSPLEVDEDTEIAAASPASATGTAETAAVRRGVLRGVILDDGGQPRPMTPLLLSSDNVTESEGGPPTGSLRLRALSGVDGRFEFSDLGPGTYALTVLRSEGDPDEKGILHRTFTIDSKTELDVEIPLEDLDSMRVTGLVHPPSEIDYALVASFLPYSDEGSFVMGAPAAGYGEGSPEGGASVPPGDFAAEGLTEGTYLVLLMPAVDDHEGPFAFLPGVEITSSRGGTKPMDFEYPTNVITGHILRTEPTEGLIVTAIPVVESGMAKAYSEGPKMARLFGRPVNASGAFEIPFIAEGDYRVDVYSGPRGERLASQVIEVIGGMSLPDWKID